MNINEILVRLLIEFARIIISSKTIHKRIASAWHASFQWIKRNGWRIEIGYLVLQMLGVTALFLFARELARGKILTADMVWSMCLLTLMTMIVYMVTGANIARALRRR